MFNILKRPPTDLHHRFNLNNIGQFTNYNFLYITPLPKWYVQVQLPKDFTAGLVRCGQKWVIVGEWTSNEDADIIKQTNQCTWLQLSVQISLLTGWCGLRKHACHRHDIEHPQGPLYHATLCWCWCEVWCRQAYCLHCRPGYTVYCRTFPAAVKLIL